MNILSSKTEQLFSRLYSTSKDQYNFCPNLSIEQTFKLYCIEILSFYILWCVCIAKNKVNETTMRSIQFARIGNRIFEGCSFGISSVYYFIVWTIIIIHRYGGDGFDEKPVAVTKRRDVCMCDCNFYFLDNILPILTSVGIAPSKLFLHEIYSG